MEKRASVKDIAQELHISLSTVHKALTGKGGISEERRKEVLETARRLGYEVNSVAQSLARKDINIGILMASKWPDYFTEMREGMEREIRNLQKYKVKGLFYALDEDLSGEETQRVLDWIRENRISVLIYCPSIYYLREAFLQAVSRIGVPMFLAGDSFEEIERISEIRTDNVMSGRLAADFLRCVRGTELRAAVFTGSLRVKPHREKVEAFAARLERFGGSIQAVYETEDEPGMILEAMQKVCDTDVNAIYVTTATSGPVCDYLEKHQLGGRFTLICTDVFQELKEYMKRGIVNATIYQNQEQVGRIAVRSAYDYLVRSTSYGNEMIETNKTVCIRPCLYLLADIEE